MQSEHSGISVCNYFHLKESKLIMHKRAAKLYSFIRDFSRIHQHQLRMQPHQSNQMNASHCFQSTSNASPHSTYRQHACMKTNGNCHCFHTLFRVAQKERENHFQEKWSSLVNLLKWKIMNTFWQMGKIPRTNARAGKEYKHERQTDTHTEREREWDGDKPSGR